MLHPYQLLPYELPNEPEHLQAVLHDKHQAMKHLTSELSGNLLLKYLLTELPGSLLLMYLQAELPGSLQLMYQPSDEPGNQQLMYLLPA